MSENTDRKMVAFICHPIGGDVEGNINKVLEIYRLLAHEGDVIPFAPYIASLRALDDANEEERKMGMEHNLQLIKYGKVDLVLVCGDKISNGMTKEIEEAYKAGVMIASHGWELHADLVDLTDRLHKEYGTQKTVENGD